MELRGKVAVVTGGAGLIGFETCAQLAQAGVSVVVNGRDAARCADAVRRLSEASSGVNAKAFAADISDPQACVRLVEFAEQEFGALHIVVHCALSPVSGTQGAFETTDSARFHEVLQQAVAAPMYLAHAAIPALKRAGGGAIVAFPSDAGKVAAPNQAITGSTRAAVMMFMRSLALEVSQYAIRCNCIAPTYVDSPAMAAAASDSLHGSRFAKAIARAKLGLPTASELAALALFLCGPDGRHITGQVISANGGLNAA